MDKAAINESLTGLLQEGEHDRELLRRFPVERYIRHLEEYPRLASYKYVSPAVKDMDEGIAEGWGHDSLERYHNLVLATLISRIDGDSRLAALPGEIRECYQVNFKRILGQVIAKAKGSAAYQYSVDGFQKDLAVCTFRMIPTGSRKVQLSKLPVRLLFRYGIIQSVRGAYLILRMGGISPFYIAHMDSHDPDAMAEFNYKGSVIHYKRVAMLLEMNKDVKGIFGKSWFHDPKIRLISPRLIYLREIIEKNGGYFFYAGQGSHTIRDALLKSPTRRRLYQEGAYSPKDYLFIWPRRPLLEWAKSST